MTNENTNEPVILITGASRGIGAAAARACAAAGHPVAVNYANDGAAAGAVVADIERAGGRARAFQADVADAEAVRGLFDAVESTLGGIGALVNNAGVTGGFSRLEDLDPDTLRRVLEVNVAGPMLCAKEAVRRLSTKRGGPGGAIVNLSSKAARIGGGGEWIHYAVTKGAIETFTLGLAREVAQEGIRVNAVAPGLIETDLHAAAGEPERCARLAAGIPIGRAGTAEEIAGSIVWLLSPAASYVTGAVLDVTGGR